MTQSDESSVVRGGAPRRLISFIPVPGAALVALLGVAHQSWAQRPDLDLAFGASAIACDAVLGPGRATGAELRAQWPYARAAVSGFASGSGVPAGHAGSLSLLTPEWRSWRADASVSWRSPGSACEQPSRRSTRTAQLSWRARTAGLSLGISIPGGDMTSRALAPMDSGAPGERWTPASSAAVAGWHDMGALRLSLGINATRGSRSSRSIASHLVQVADSFFNDTIGAYVPFFRQVGRADTIDAAHGANVLGLIGRIAFASGALAAEAAVARSLSHGAPRYATSWMEARLTYALGPAVSVLGSLSSLPDALHVTAGPSPWRGSLGFRLASSPFSRPTPKSPPPERAVAHAFRITDGAEGIRVLAIRAPHASMVEVAGDFVEWRATRMHRTSADWWEIRVRIPSGTWRVNVRLDGGAWQAPPGLPALRDEFGGTVGVLVVP